MLHERIDRALYVFPLFELADMLHKHIGIKGCGVVVVEFCALLVGELRVCLVVEVVADCRHIVILESLLQTLYKRTLTCSSLQA